MEDSSVVLVQQYRGGDDEAAEQLFARYAARLVALAQRRLSPMMGRRVDPDDVVQSVYRAFFDRVRSGDFVLQQRGDLWRLLVAITMNKIRQKVEFHQAEKRHIGREQSCEAGQRSAVRYAVPDRSPTPEEMVGFIEEINLLAARLNESQRQMLMLRLQGYKLEEIAQRVNRCERTVRRVLEQVKTWLQDRAAAHEKSASPAQA